MGKMLDNESNFYWEWILHEDHIFTNRGNFFVVAEAMLFSSLNGFTSMISIEKVAICMLGIFLSLIWFWVSAISIYITQKEIKRKLGEIEPRWNEIRIKRRKWGKAHFLIGILLPLGFIVVWFLFLFIKS
jgi:hypothetical protein